MRVNLPAHDRANKANNYCTPRRLRTTRTTQDKHAFVRGRHGLVPRVSPAGVAGERLPRKPPFSAPLFLRRSRRLRCGPGGQVGKGNNEDDEKVM